VSQQPPRIALVWAQFGAYHVDRCEAVGQHLSGEADVLAVEVASRSRHYLWEPSGDLQCARKVTLFPGGCYEDIPVTRKARALFSVLRRCDIAYFGIGYNELYVILVAWLLRLMGKRVVMMTDSKFEDMPRSVWFEMFKSAVLFVFQGAIVAGHRQESYLRLGFRKRPVMLGYDVVSGERLARQALANRPSVSIADEDRPLSAWRAWCPRKICSPCSMPMPPIVTWWGSRAAAGPGGQRAAGIGSVPQDGRAGDCGHDRHARLSGVRGGGRSGVRCACPDPDQHRGAMGSCG
jgi:hypothetical protein